MVSPAEMEIAVPPFANILFCMEPAVFVVFTSNCIPIPPKLPIPPCCIPLKLPMLPGILPGILPGKLPMSPMPIPPAPNATYTPDVGVTAMPLMPTAAMVPGFTFR